MQNLNKKIFAIQDDLDTLKSAIIKVRNTDNNLLVTNCISRLKLGNQKLHIIFDTLLYNDDKNILIMIKDSSVVSPELFKEMLNNNNVGYNELNFREYLHFDKPETSKELFFATSISNLKYVIEKSMKNGSDSCTYYPAITGHFTLKYFYNKEKQEQLDDYYIKGLLELDDKIILIIKESIESTLYFKRILHELEKMNINVIVDYSKQIKESLKEKKIIKKKKRRILKK